MKPMLASDAILPKLNFPIGAQPKIDGVRAVNNNGGCFARSLKPIRNRYTQEFFSRPYFAGLDGEMAAGPETDADLCRVTTSATSSIDGKPFILWWVFDYRLEEFAHESYRERYERLKDRVHTLQNNPTFQPWAGHLRVVPMVIVHSLDELLALEEQWLNEGYEGVILRNLDAPYKFGRSTPREAGLLRIKRFVDFEFEVTSIEEGTSNENEAQKNELGLQFRSTHQENMVPNGMVGKVHGKAIADVLDPTTKVVIIRKGDAVMVGPGNMPHDQRRAIFLDPRLIVGKIGKGKFFPKGIKDKPRFPTWISLRDESDL